jgi:hypothetical protein
MCHHVSNVLYNHEDPHFQILPLHLDSKMTWKVQIAKKRKEMDIKILKKCTGFLGKKSSLSLENKLLLYRVIIKPIWTYGIELWGLL